MSWTERFTTIVHEGTETPGESPAERALRRHDELLAALGRRERASATTVVHLHAGALAIAAGGEPLYLMCECDALLDDVALLDALAGRELIVVGDAGSLLRFIEGVRERGLCFVQVLIDHVPALPSAARRLQQRFGCSVGEALAEPGRGWLALAARFGELLTPVQSRSQLYLTSSTGSRIETEDWGQVGVSHEERRRCLPIWARWQRSRANARGLQIGVPETPLDSRGELRLNVQDLHSLLGALPVFAYNLRLRDEASLLRVSIVPGVDVEQAKRTVIEALARGLQDPPVEFAEPGVEFDGPRVDDVRIGHVGRLVQVVWAGVEHSVERRSAWQVALASAGVSGFERVRLVDAAGEPFTDPLVAEVLAELRRDTELEREWTVAIGDPRKDRSADGWVVELAADETHDGMLVAGRDRSAVTRVVELFTRGEVSPELAQLALRGVHMQPFSRPTLAAGPVASGPPLLVDAQRCTGAGDCVRVCPTRAITLVEQRPRIDADACIRCHLCSERCEQLALRPHLDADAFVEGTTLLREAKRIEQIRDRVRPRALVGKLAEPPVAKAPATIRRKPTVVLGLATVTLMEHAAALLIDGQLVAGIEEERLARVRHYSFQHPDKPGASLSSETCMRLEDAWPQRSIQAVLDSAGLTMDDVDVVAINGIPARLIHSFSGGSGWRPPPVLRANSIVFVPHHMSHAASVYGLSGFSDAWILSVDGRGDYETATVWRAEGNELEIIDAVPWLPDRSFGGVYETATRTLGFGTHGQGSTMALAALGEPVIDVSDCMGIADDGSVTLSEWAAEKRFAPYQRSDDGELTDEHKNLAASVQRALETTVSEYLARHVGDLRGQNLGICGGVALNCRMNGTLRARFEPAQMLVPPGANDAGTAIGAAMIGHRELTGELPRLDFGHTHIGPAWSDEAIARSLERMRVPFQRLRDVGSQTAELIAAGKIVCWFQGPMEFGPRALGGRSILADPRREQLKPRLNAIKSRQSWRPFGPSILAGRQHEWFTHDWDSRFMLFAVDVRPDKRGEIPVVVHYDGSTRPQVVHREHHGRYHDLISAFDRLTGVPMVVNTSFNRGGEPIVCNPAEALRSFAGLGADAIVLGDCLVRRELLRKR
jgi:predicted NodU family carbamoyl transferase/ferredoxin